MAIESNSRTEQITVRCFAFRSRGQVIAVCLDLALATQADTLDEAKRALHDQIMGYVEDLVEEGLPFERRPAPLSVWIRYWRIRALARAVAVVPNLLAPARRRIENSDVFQDEVQLQPA